MESGDGDVGVATSSLGSSVKEERIETVVIEQVLDANLAGLDNQPQLVSPSSLTTMVIASSANTEQNGAMVYTTIAPITAANMGAYEEGDLMSPESPGPASPPSGGGKMKRRSVAGHPGSSSKEEKLICLVCGDKALGCNFDAISCESCKAFFRRNALKTKATKCLFEGSCKIDVNTRRFCPHCRLNKCFAVGMKKQFILGDDEKKKRMAKVIQNRKRRGGSNSNIKEESPATPQSTEAGSSMPNSPVPSNPATPATPTGPLTPGSVSSQNPPTPVPPVVPPVVQTITTAVPPAIPGPSQQLTVPVAASLASQLASNSFIPTVSVHTGTPLGTSAPGLAVTGTGVGTSTSAGTTTVTFTTPPIPAGATEILNSQTIAEAVHQAIQLQVMQQTQNMDISNLLSLSKLIKPTDMYTSQVDSFLVRRLTTEESAMLGDLMQIYDLSFTVDLEPLIHIKQIDPSLDQLVNQSSITVLRIIKFAKRLEEFVKLPQECQIGILKGCWIHILLLRSVSVYDSIRDVWGTPRGDIPTEILKNATGYVQLHDDHINYCKSIKNIIRDDLTIVVILIVIVLFSPEGPHVMTRELVSNIQDRYLVLLKHYLESKYTYIRSAEMFPQLMSKLKELKELAEVHGRVLLDVNPSEIEPIMLEILDLSRG